MQDLQSLAALGSSVIFHHGLTLLKKKHGFERKRQLFTGALQSGERDGCATGSWFTGATAFGLPRTNNSLESFNNILKEFVMCRNRLALGDLVRRIIEEVGYLSVLAKQGAFAFFPAATRTVYVYAQNWLRETIPLLVRLKRAGHFLIPSAETKEKSTNHDNCVASVREQAKLFLQQDLRPHAQERFKGYMARVTAFWSITPLTTPIDHVHFQCTCFPFNDKATCKHALSMSIWTETTAVPHQWKVNKLQPRNKRGRPELAAKALQRQPLQHRNKIQKK